MQSSVGDKDRFLGIREENLKYVASGYRQAWKQMLHSLDQSEEQVSVWIIPVKVSDILPVIKRKQSDCLSLPGTVGAFVV